MTTRRNFLKKTGLATAALATPFQNLFAEMKLQNKMGIQLFSLPKMLSEDFEKGIKMLSAMGYKELELYGPFSFSTEAAKKRWAAVTPQLGFSGSGYFGKDIKDVKKLLSDNGLSTPAMHTDMDTLLNGMDKLGEAAHVLGQKYVTLPSIPDELRKNLDDYKRVAETFNKIGENAKKNGIKFGYHNHGYGIKPMNEQIPLQIILENTDPNLVFFELDIFWTASGGADPIEYLTKYPNRYKMLHLKDMKEKKEFSGDGGNASQWIPLFGNMTTAGDGILDLKGIIKKAKEIGVEHYFVEQDMVASPEIALKRSLDFLKPKI
ncbi:twin-arginine translocation signal domain-containing protein [Lacihabitans sp. CCS-44]|uniref:TIM barrel protein n=1 Tax=Lacihabitans sp. CCS-44 TaxID=2487331 RepID=UPI0020CD86F5|nr:TIM barrel protein [Lacihabitans sp. CCS-44]MCP9753809.1 twin-arginine translocation signal domain-containing protein [Lacihabitans sp. CCS-44]